MPGIGMHADGDDEGGMGMKLCCCCGGTCDMDGFKQDASCCCG